MNNDVAYYEYYDCEMYDHIAFRTENGKTHDCAYYLFYPKDAELDENTPVIAYITHGGGMVEEERALTLHRAAGQNTRAIFVIPYTTDAPEAVCTALADARDRLGGKGNFDAVSGHGTSSGGRAIIRAALESVRAGTDYGIRFTNVCAYDPAEESNVANITGRTSEMRALAGQGTVLFIQTVSDRDGQHGGSGAICNRYARTYSDYGGICIVAEIDSASHEGKFLMPLSHNSINRAIGAGMLSEDDMYRNHWYCYQDGIKHPATPEEATAILRHGETPAEDSGAERPAA